MKKEINKTATKTARIDMRVVPELNERVKEMAAQVSKSRNALIEHIIWKAVLCPESIFVLCPNCKVPMFDHEEIPITSGTSVMECVNGHENEFCFDKNKFL